jgi:hypothetical protein
MNKAKIVYGLSIDRQLFSQVSSITATFMMGIILQAKIV